MYLNECSNVNHKSLSPCYNELIHTSDSMGPKPEKNKVKINQIQVFIKSDYCKNQLK